MNPNQVILVNENDEFLGEMDKIEAHRKGILHRAISVLIFNSKNEWLLQQRAAKKYHSPLLWSNSTCTHPMIGEKTIDASHRRLKEEMGMESSLKELFSFQYRAELDQDMIENEFDHVFIGNTDDVPKINKDEVESYRYISTTDLQAEINDSPENFTEWFKILFHRVNSEIV
jgi:isopentenyl-diphosphate Delta-isomerase